MSETLGALLDDARRRSFVGRDDELASFEAALTDAAGHRVLFVHGPGGIGKTTLLHRLRIRARELDRPVLHFDGREQSVTREMLAAAVDDAADGVLLVDGYEYLSSIDDWVREQLLPSMPASAVVVLAGREAPGTAWRSDPGWRQLVAVHALSPFDDLEGREVLARARVASEHHEHLLRLGRGHPLALALLADVAAMGRIPEHLADAPDVVAALLPAFLDSVPDDSCAAGLELCALSWVTTEALLEHVLGDDARDVWQWLESLPFVVRSPLGLHPHDLARDVLAAEQLRRSPASGLRVHRTVRAFGMDAVRHAPIEVAHVAALQILYLHRNSPLTSPFWALRDGESLGVQPGRPTDHAGVLEIIEREEGVAAAQLAARWLETQPESFRVLRSGDHLRAFAVEPVIPADSALEADDRVVRAVLEATARLGPLRPGEQLSIGRFFGAPEGYQTGGEAVVSGSVSSLMTWLTRALAWSWIVTVSSDFWDPVFDYLGFEHRVELPGDRKRVAYGMDWRRIGVDVWLDEIGRRELSGVTGPLPKHLLRPVPLDRTRFTAAIRDAIRSVRDLDALRESPLLHTRILDNRERNAAQLAAALVRGVDTVGDASDGEELARVLRRTYVQAAPSQEAAAHTLDMSLSTYRRRLARALDALGDVLWAVEIGERALDGGDDVDDSGSDASGAG